MTTMSADEKVVVQVRDTVFMPHPLDATASDDERLALLLLMGRVAEASGRSMAEVREATYRLWGHMIAGGPAGGRP
ncbi:MAG: hypothetical protein ACI38Z_04590 [Parafannyhessea sp.]|uniref:hypothetical protein n=1 Tax=Parafannyhessea sp. TaxID=2847324 RepID=UPI003EFEEE96